MNISDRKKKILQVVVDEYINTAVPVSSKVVAENSLVGVSSATVRNELASLEELGFLTQYHTSGGRVPSPLAYKLYIDELMQRNALSETDLQYITEAFETQTNDIENIIKKVTKVISDLTDYPSVAVAHSVDKEIIDNIALVSCGPKEALLLIVTSTRILRDNIIDIPEKMERSDLENASRVIGKMFCGKAMVDVVKLEGELLAEFTQYKEIFKEVIEVLRSYSKTRDKDVMVSGEDKIFNHPEYENIENVKNFLTVVSSKERLADILTEGDEQIHINVQIGSDEGSEKKDNNEVPKDCSLVTATYSAGGKNLGTYGVIGPIRMDYSKVISVLEQVGVILENIINKGGNSNGKQ